MILMARADDRLVHGMVGWAWTQLLKPETILVANDETANDSFKNMTIKLAKPAGVNLVIKTIEDSIKALNNPINDKRRIFLVTESVEDAYKIFQQVTGITKMNISTAGVNRKPNEEYIATLPMVFMTKKEFEYAELMNAAGVEVFAQTTPIKDRMEFPEIVKKFSK